MLRLRAILPALAVLVLAAGPGATQDSQPAAPEPEPQVVAMGTGNVAGVYFPVGVALCRLANQHRRETGLRCAARPTAGSVTNIDGIRDGTFELAIVQSDTQADALNGTGAFAAAGPYSELRAVMALYPELLTIVARADAGVTGLADLAGKRVALGEPGSGTRVIADALIAALGWTTASFAATPDLPPDRVANALCDGEIDAFFYAVGHPAAVIQAATTDCDATLIDAGGALVNELVEKTPSFVAATIPAGPLPRHRPPGRHLRRQRDAGHPRRRARRHHHRDRQRHLRRHRHAARPRPGARQARSRGHGRGRPLRPAASGGGPLLPRARLGPLVSPRFQPVASAQASRDSV